MEPFEAEGNKYKFPTTLFPEMARPLRKRKGFFVRRVWCYFTELED
jgi:hypothetical protein